MFAALKQDGTIDYLVPSIPTPPDPLPDGYVTIEYREVIDGTPPVLTTPFSYLYELPTSAWQVTSTQAIRKWDEIIPSAQDCKGRQKAALTAAQRSVHEAGIVVTLAPYGVLTFASDAAIDLLVCAHLCDMRIRQNAANAEATEGLVLIDKSVVSVKCIHVLQIMAMFCQVHRARHLAISAKHRAIQLATTLTDIAAIT